MRFFNTKPSRVSRLQWISVVCLLFVMAQMAVLISIVIEIEVYFIFNLSSQELTVFVAPIVEESIKAIMFLLFLRYRRSLGVQTTDAQMILAALWIGASFGFYEWSVKELASYLLFVSNISHAIKTALVLAYRMAAHGGFTVWMGITYWFGRNTSRPKFAVLFGLVFAVLFHMLHNYFSYYPDLRLISVLLALVGCINIGVVVKWYLQKKDRLRNCNEKLRHSHAFEGKRT